MLNKLITGTQNASGIITARGGASGDTIVSELHGRYYEGAVRGKRFNAAMQAVLATATIAGLNVAITGVSAVVNPINSGVNMVLEKFGVGFVLAPAAPLAYGIAVGINTATAVAGTLTSLGARNSIIGGSAPVCAAYASAAITLPTQPTVAVVLGALEQGAVTTTTNNPSLYDLEGSIILPPGAYACFWTSAVLAASAHIASWQWEEVPILP